MSVRTFVGILAVAALGACRGDAGTTAGDASPPGIDAPDGTGCTTRTPRAVEPTAFVGPTGLQARLAAAIDGAQHTLDVQMYLFTVQALADRVVAAKQRGVAVRVILDPDEAGNASVRTKLTNAGVPTRNATPLYTYSHAKYLVIDGATTYLMSMNFNVDAMNTERNYGMVDRDPEDVADVAAIFAMDWAAAGGEAPRPADLTCTRLVVSPDNARARLLELINSAQSTLAIEALYLTETNVRAAVGQAKTRGVAVRVMLATPDTTPDDTTKYLQTVGIPIKWANPNDFLLHAKLVMTESAAFVGSENLSLTSLTKNREVGAIVFEPAQVATIRTQFEADWSREADAPAQ